MCHYVCAGIQNRTMQKMAVRVMATNAPVRRTRKLSKKRKALRLWRGVGYFVHALATTPLVRGLSQ